MPSKNLSFTAYCRMSSELKKHLWRPNGDVTCMFSFISQRQLPNVCNCFSVFYFFLTYWQGLPVITVKLCQKLGLRQSASGGIRGRQCSEEKSLCYSRDTLTPLMLGPHLFSVYTLLNYSCLSENCLKEFPCLILRPRDLIATLFQVKFCLTPEWNQGFA